jgi:hypothetical protein
MILGHPTEKSAHVVGSEERLDTQSKGVLHFTERRCLESFLVLLVEFLAQQWHDFAREFLLVG